MGVSFQKLNLSDYATTQALEALINDADVSADSAYSSQKIDEDFLQKNGDSSETTVTFESSAGDAPASGGTLGTLIGWLFGKCGQIGSLAALATTVKDSIVNAINEISNSIGALSSLETTEKTSVVGAINEVFSNARSKLILVNVPKAILTANCSFVNGYVKSLFSINLPSSLNLGSNSGQSDWRNILFIAGYIFNYGTAENYNTQQIILAPGGLKEVSSGVYAGSSISAKMDATGTIEAELDVASANDTDASIFKGSAGNMLIIVGKQADFITVNGNDNPYS